MKSLEMVKAKLIRPHLENAVQLLSHHRRRELVFVLALLFFAAWPQSRAFAQAGRPIQQPAPSPTPVDSSAPAKFFGRNKDPYKVVFPTTPDVVVNLDAFVKKLNEAGKQGYKLLSVVYRWQPKSASVRQTYFVPVAILKLDEVQHEYAWFQTTSNTVINIDGFASRFDKSSKQGFELVDRFLIQSYCDPSNVLGSIGINVMGDGEPACQLNDLFLLRRRKGAKPRKFILARSPVRPGWKLRNETDLNREIQENLPAGFYPVHLFTKWEILLADTEQPEQRSADTPEVRVVMTFGLTTVREKVNALGKQGFRLATMNKSMAVMYRYGENTKPFAYTWVKAGDKGLDAKLAKLQAEGAVYRMSYPEPVDVKNRLVFEQGPVVEGRRQEYKVVTLEFQSVSHWELKSPQPQVDIELADSSKAALNTLVNQGFVVRDLFVSDTVTNKVSVLLERSRDRITMTQPQE